VGEVIDWITELWRSIWSFLGPIATVLLIILILYIREPEKFDRIAIHISWALSRASRHFEKSAIRREVKYLITREFIRNFPREEVPEIPEIDVEWGWKAVSAFIIICSAQVHWFVLQLKLISIQSIVVLMMR
jgi:hypothetical protein